VLKAGSDYGGKMIKIGKKALSGIGFFNGTCPRLLKKGVDPFYFIKQQQCGN